MKNFLKQSIKAFIAQIVKILRKSNPGGYLLEVLLNEIMHSIRVVNHGSITLNISTPNRLNYWRAETFSTKEPETLEWIDSFENEAVVWDIGANVGLYSCYAAKAKNCKVYAFEPSVFNLELLARNTFLNDLVDKIVIVPLPLAETLSISQMKLTTTEWGGALSTFGQDFGWDGKRINKVFEYQTIGMSMADTIKLLKIPTPKHIKMDVDGLEHFILKGGVDVLEKIESVLIEVNDDFQEQVQSVEEILLRAGLVLKEKRQSDLIANSTTGFQNSYDQIWIRV